MAKQVDPIPEGFRSVTPHLVVRGAEKAIEFYKKAFGATERYRMLAPNGSIGHAEITIGNSIVMLAEEDPSMKITSPKTLNGTASGLLIYTEDTDAAYKRAIDAGATPVMPPVDIFWGDRYSKLEDPFGHMWSISTHMKDLTHEEIVKGKEEFFAKMKQLAAAGKH